MGSKPKNNIITWNACLFDRLTPSSSAVDADWSAFVYTSTFFIFQCTNYLLGIISISIITAVERRRTWRINKAVYISGRVGFWWRKWIANHLDDWNWMIIWRVSTFHTRNWNGIWRTINSLSVDLGSRVDTKKQTDLTISLESSSENFFLKSLRKFNEILILDFRSHNIVVCYPEVRRRKFSYRWRGFQIPVSLP